MKQFVVRLSEEQREALEGHRKAWGLPSLADAVRHLIETKADVPFSDEERGKIMGEIAQRVSKAAKPLLSVQDAKPFKSRLKGEWKAP